MNSQITLQRKKEIVNSSQALPIEKRRVSHSADKFRVQLDFSGKALSELDLLKEKLSASARSEVIRNALRWLYWVTDEVSQGATILVEREGKQREVVFPFAAKPERRNSSLANP